MNSLIRILLASALLPAVSFGADTPLRRGLIEPTAEQRASFEAVAKEYQIPFEASPLPSRVVNTTYLPPVEGGYQGNLGICGSICITYFTATHQLAKARGWTAPGHDGDFSRVTSPAWGVLAYPHAVAGGRPNGASPSVVIDEIIRSGIRSMADFPYSDQMDYTVFPSFEDRALALHWRAKSAIRINDVHSPAGILSLKHLLAGGDIVATATKYSPTLFAYRNPSTHPDVNNEVLTRKGNPDVGHAMTIVGYDDNKAYIDPETGATRYGAYLLVNSWGTDWGVSVPEVGTGGFIWIPYELEGFLYGAYTLYFPEEDTVPELYGDMRLTDFDGNWIATRRSSHFWYQYCQYELPGSYNERFPDFNSYNATDSYAFAFDASVLAEATFPRVKISMVSLATEAEPEGSVAFAVYDEPSESVDPVTAASTEVWSYSESNPRREFVHSPMAETVPDLGIATGRGTIAVADLDGDGADEFVASYLEAAPPGQNFGPARLVLGRNDGSGQFTIETLPSGDAYGQVLWADMDRDSDLDFLVSSRDRTEIFANDGSGNFAATDAALPGSGLGGISVADFDRDGRFDLVLANVDEGLLLLRQLPDGRFEERAFGREIPRNAYGVDATGVAVGDVNGDGWPDFVFWDHDSSGYGTNNLLLALNTGDLHFEFRALPVPADLDGVALAFGDFNNDGCDDLAWSGGNSPDYVSRESHFGVLQGAPNGWMRAVPMEPGLAPVIGGNLAWGDLNHDGALDLLVAGREVDFGSTTGSTLEEANLGYYLNRLYFLSYENGYFVESSYALTGVSGSTRSTLLAPLDVDGDGDLDLFSAGYRGKTSETALSAVHEALCRSSVFLNSFDSFSGSHKVNTPPVGPTQFVATPATNQITFSWSGATDAETPADGLRYHLQVGTTPGGSDVLSGTTGPLSRATAVLTDVPAGTLYWRVRTVDAASALSPWSANQTVSMPTHFIQRRVTVARSSGGLTTPAAGAHLVNAGSSLEVSAQAAAGYQLKEWLVNGTPRSGNPLVLTPTQAWTEVEPVFEVKSSTPEVNDWEKRTFNAGSYFPAHKWGSSEFATVAFNGYMYMFPGYGESMSVWRSSDGASWVPGHFMGNSGFTLPYAQATVWDGRIWLRAGKTVYSATQAANGTLSWTTETTGAPWSSDLQYAGFIGFAGKLWFVSGYAFGGYSDVYSSSNGRDWSWSASVPWTPQTYTRLVVAEGTLLALTSATSTSDGEVWASTDGINWVRQTAAAPWKRPGSNWLSERFISAATFDGLVHVVSAPNEHFISPDKGVSWVKAHPEAADTSHFSESLLGELVGFGDKLYLLGAGGDDMMLKEYWSLAAGAGGQSIYALNMAVEGDEGGTTVPAPGAHFDEQGTYPIEARPAPGFVFVEWTGPVGDAQSSTTTVGLNANTSVRAVFAPAPDELAAPGSVAMTTRVSPAGSGDIRAAANANVTPASALEDGSTRVQAIARAGWVFSHWQGAAVHELRSATTAIIPENSGPVTITACFRPASAGSIDARGNTNALVDAAGNQWLWGSRAAGAEAHLWNSPRGGSVPPFAFNDLDFRLGETPRHMLTSMGTLLRSRSEGIAVSLDNASLLFPEHRFVAFSTCGVDEWAYALAIDPEGDVWAWGNNAFGQLGDGTQVDRTAPVKVQLPAAETFVEVAAGNTFAMALSRSGKVYVWGANSFGQTGPSGMVNLTPVPVPGLEDIRDIAAGTNHGLALDAAGDVFAWGQDMYGQVSGRIGGSKDTPARLDSLSAHLAFQHVQVAVSSVHGDPMDDGPGTTFPAAGDYILRPYEEFSIAAEDGERYQFSAWQGAVLDRDAPRTTAKARPGSTIQALFELRSSSPSKLNLSINHPEAGTLDPVAGITEYPQGETIVLQTEPAPSWRFDHWMINGAEVSDPKIEVVMDRDITVEAIYTPQAFRTRAVPGFLNSWGQPVDYDDDYKFDPTYTGPLFVDAATTNYNGYVSVYLSRDGSLWYSDGMETFDPVPGETEGLDRFTDVKQVVATNSGFMLAVRIDGTIWTWGHVPGEAQVRPRPAQVAGLRASDYRQIIGVGTNLLFLRTNGTLASWGTDATLTGSGVRHDSLTTVPGVAGVKQVVGNAFSALALKGDGTVWGWGDNYNELLGRSWNDLAASPLPVQVPGLSDIDRLFAGGFAIDGQNRAWVWGLDSGGNKGLPDDINQSILPPKVHPTFPVGALTASYDNPNYIVLENGEMWAYGINTPYSVREPGGQLAFNIFKVKADLIGTPIVHRRLSVSTSDDTRDWISHLPGTHTYLLNDEVMLWTNTPVTWQCDGWLINGELDRRSSIVLRMDRDYTVEPRFSLRPPSSLPAPRLIVGRAEVEQNQLNQAVSLPISLSEQDYITPEGLQFAVHLPAGLPRPTVTVPDELIDGIEVIEEWEPLGADQGVLLKLLLTARGDLFATPEMVLARLNFDLGDTAEGHFPIRLESLSRRLPSKASEDDGMAAVPLGTTDGFLELASSDRLGIRFLTVVERTRQEIVSDEVMESLDSWDSLRSDLDKYLEVWVRGAPGSDLSRCSYDLSLTGGARFVESRQPFIEEESLTGVLAPDGSSLTGMGGLISDAKIVSFNDLAPQPYTPGEWMRIALIPLSGSDGTYTLAMSNIEVELFGEAGVEQFSVPDQSRSLRIAPNAPPSASVGRLSTGSTDMLFIKPDLQDVNPQDLEDISLIIRRQPVHGYVVVDPNDPQGFIYHPPTNGTFSGTTSFEYAVSDGFATSDAYTVDLSVNNAPRFVDMPDYVDSIEGAGLTQLIRVEDADTPAGELVFSLEFAPAWLQVSNNGDYTATLTGQPEANSDGYDVFSVRVDDPLSQQTRRTTMLLVIQPDGTGVIVNVLNGIGGGTATPGTTRLLSAGAPVSGEGFLSWVGDIAYLDDPQSEHPLVRVPGRDISLMAVYVPLAAMTFEEWADQMDPGSRPTGLSPAGDGISNLAKYALGLVPDQAYGEPVAAWIELPATVGDSARMVLRYHRSKLASAALITPVWSSTLAPESWRTDTIDQTLIEETDALETWEVSLPIDPSDPLFMKLNFSLSSE